MSDPTPLTLHLTDRAGIPLLSSSNQASNESSPNPSQPRALATLSQSAITAYETASRLGYGRPTRLLITTRANGPILTHTFIAPPPRQPPPPPPRSPNPHPTSAPRPTPRAHSPAPAPEDPLTAVLSTTRSSLRPVSPMPPSSPSLLPNGEVAEQASAQNLEGEDGETREEDGDNGAPVPPLLITTVIAPGPSHAPAARRATARLESVGREFQRRWVVEGEREREEGVVQGDGGADGG